VGSNLRYNRIYNHLFDNFIQFDEVKNDRAYIGWSYVSPQYAGKTELYVADNEHDSFATVLTVFVSGVNGSSG